MKFTNTIKSIAIGSFDGIHIAHKALIDKVDALVVIERNGGYLTPGYKRSLYTDKFCCFYHFDKVKSLTSEAFVTQLRNDFPSLNKIVVGYDFHFGKGKMGNAEMLQSLFDKEVIIVDEVSCENIPVHSRTIKEYLRDGNIDMANKLLGRRYCIDGEVITGQGIGKKELVPTLNIVVNDYQLPLEGVYVTRTKIRNKWFASVSFLGHRVTIDGSYAIETHILDRDLGKISGKILIEFIAFMRGNQKFDGIDSLREQIEEDIYKAKRYIDER